MKTKLKIAVALIALISIFIVPTSSVAFAEDTIYPFDSITIKSAYHFEVLCLEEPTNDSYLFGYVNAGENIKVYVGELEFVDGTNNSNSSIAIITNENDEDICSWIINSMYLDMQTNVSCYSYSSHITIDPEIGVVKNENFLYNTVITKDSDTNECTFSAQNWDNTIYCTYSMIAGTYQEETGLNIIISAYIGG